MQNSITIAPDLVSSTPFKEAVALFRKELYEYGQKISETRTPEVDGAGRKIIERRPDGFDFIPAHYLINRLDCWFPGWSWEPTFAPQILGIEWVVSSGCLSIICPEMLAWGIVPPVRKFYAQAAKRIAHKAAEKDRKTGKIIADAPPHSADTIIDLKNDVEACNSMVLKKAIQQLTHICDDVYGNRVEDEGMGTYEDLFESSPNATNFAWMLKNRLGISAGDAIRTLGVSDLTEIADYHIAYEQLKAAHGS